MSLFDNLQIGLEGASAVHHAPVAAYDDHAAETANQEMSELLVELNQANAELELGMAEMNRYCDTLDYLGKFKPETPTERALANALAMSGGSRLDSPDEINAMFAGLESASADDVGLERRYVRKIRDTVKKVVDWFIAQYERIRKIVTDFFQKYFGSFERLRRQVEAIATKAGEMTGYEIETRTVEIGDFIQPFYRRGRQVTSLSDLTKGVGDYAAVVGAYNDAVIGGVDKVINEFVAGMKTIDVNGDKVDMSKLKTDLMDRHDAMVQKAFKPLVVPYSNATDPRFPNQSVMVTKVGLLGNRDLFITSIAGENNRDTIAGRAAAINASDIRLMNWKPERKKGDVNYTKDGKFNTLTTAEVGDFASTIMGCMDQVINLARSEDRQKFATNLDNAYSQFQKMKGEMSREDFTPELRQSLQMVGSQLTKFRRVLMDIPLNVCNDSRTICAAMVRLCSASLSNHKKTEGIKG